MNLSYSFDDNTAAVTEDNLSVYKCDNWNYTSRACASDFEVYSNVSIRTDQKIVVVNVTSFSGYVVSEGTCGNSVCQAAYGETTDTCVADCVVASSSSSSSGGGGGGGGSSSSSSSTTTTTEKSSAGALQLSVTKIESIVDVGDNVSDFVRITNSKSSKAVIDILIEEGLQEVMSTDTPRIELDGNGAKVVSFKISGAKEGVYQGNILIVESGEVQTIPVEIVVKGSADKLLDVSVVLGKDNFDAGEELEFTVAAFNLGQLPRYDIFFSYDIIPVDGNGSVLHHEESVAIETSLSLSRSLVLPGDLEDGKYNLHVTADYLEGQAVASAPFKIGGILGFDLVEFINRYFQTFVVFLVLGGAVGFAGYYVLSLRKKVFAKEMAEKQKNSIYPFPNFDELPQSKYAYVGLIADADKKVYLDHTQLNRHTLIAGGTGSGKTVAGMDIVEEILGKGLGVVVLDPVGQWTGFAKKNTDEKMKKLYKKFGMGGAKEYQPRVVEITADKMNLDVVHYLTKKGLTILRLDHLKPKQADEFIEHTLEQIYRAGFSETDNVRALLVLDEVHRLLPKYGGRRAYRKLEQAVREYRKWGIGLVMISQVLTDFKGAIRGNIGTEIQMSSRYEGDLKRVRERHGKEISRLIPRMSIGLGMVESVGYNKGNPYFVQFRPLYHSPLKLSEKDIKVLARKDEAVLIAGSGKEEDQGKAEKVKNKVKAMKENRKKNPEKKKVVSSAVKKKVGDMKKARKSGKPKYSLK